MKLLRDVQQLDALGKGVAASIGNFDGVHLGHQHLIHSLRIKANEMGLPVLLILFEPQPAEYLHKDKSPARLSTLREKLDVLRQCQVDYVYCIKFNERLLQTSASDFANHYLFSLLKVNYLLVGQDFRFGKNREGDVALLKVLGAEQGCEVRVFQDFCLKEERISSTKVRNALQHHAFTLAEKYLGRPYSICGRIVKGDGRGRQWGIPTANLSLHSWSLPLKGVFVIEAHWKEKILYGVANIGTRPTVDGTKNILEVHLFDFDQSIYGQLIQVFFLHPLREEIKFDSLDALISQIHQDIKAARTFLKSHHKQHNYILEGSND